MVDEWRFTGPFISRTVVPLLILITSGFNVHGQVQSTTGTIRCATSVSTAGIPAPAGGSPITLNNFPSGATTIAACEKYCVNNEHRGKLQCILDPLCNQEVCGSAIFEPVPRIGTEKCVVFPVGRAFTGILTTGRSLITIKNAACPGGGVTTAKPKSVATTTVASKKATTAAVKVAVAASTKAPSKATTVAAVAAGDSNPQCCGWAKKGECDINPFFMKITCKVSCGTKSATIQNANTVASNPSAACKPTNSAANAACKDKSTECSKWALNNQCDSNPFYMRVNCATSCRKCEGGKPSTFKNACGDTDVPAIAGCANSKDDCNFWAAIGECTRNAAWMTTNCCAACRNKAILFKNCPLAGKSPFTGVG